MSEAAYYIKVDGQEVTKTFSPLLISLSMTDADGGRADSLEITLDDSDGQIQLPRAGAEIEAAIWWVDPPDGVPADAVTFKGKTDEPTSTMSRSDGMIVTINAKSADLKGKAKDKSSRHKDDANFGDVAKEWGQKSGLQVKVDDALASIQRDYWSMANESFMAWGTRIAREVGASFKIRGTQAVFVPRNGNGALVTLVAERPGNLLSWSMSPTQNRAVYQNTAARWFDEKKAKWNIVKLQLSDDGESDLTHTFKHSDEATANKQAEANGEEAKRGKGGGTLVLLGDPRAMGQAVVQVVNSRPGIDGTYRITSAKHSFGRDGGWSVSCEVSQPQDTAGTDSRKAPTANTPTSAAGTTGNAPGNVEAGAPTGGTTATA